MLDVAYIEIYNQAAQDLDEDLTAAVTEQSEETSNDGKPQLYNLNEILDSLSD